MAGLIHATATLVTGFVTNPFQLNANRQLERDMLMSTLILKVVDAEEPDKRHSALNFLVNSGLITETGNRNA